MAAAHEEGRTPPRRASGGVAGASAAADARRMSGVKRVEDWKAEEVQQELAKYTRAEVAGSDAVCDPLVALVVDERQAVLIKLLAEAGAMMARYQQRRQVAANASKVFYDHPAVAAFYAPRGRVINLPVDVLPEETSSPTAAAAAAAEEDEVDDDDDDSSSSSTVSSDGVEPSADAPRPPLLDNTALLGQLETLMVESKAFAMVCAKVQEYLTLSLGAIDTEDTDVMEIQAKLSEEFGAAREVASDRYDFYSMYLDVRGAVERNLAKYPDVQAYRELLVARDASAWEEVARSWQLLASSLATLSGVVAQNIKYVVAPDATHDITESSLFM